MRQDATREGRALQRIVALLIALAGLADRAASRSFPVRVIVVALLRRAEAAAWAFAIESATGSSGFRPHCRRPHFVSLPGAPVRSHDGPAEAIRLALSFRALALVVAELANRVGLFAAVSSSLWPVRIRHRAFSGGNRHGPAAHPAPDTS